MTTTKAKVEEVYISSPGDTIQDLLDERNWNQKELARRLGLSHKTVNQMITGKAALTEKTASKLVAVLGSTPTFWLNREANYRAKLAEQEQSKRLMQWTSWLKALPVKDLMRAGAIPAMRLEKKNEPALVAQLLQFFRIASPDQFNESFTKVSHAFRRTKIAKSDKGAVASWLRLGEIAAEKATTPKFSEAKFKKSMAAIRKLTVQDPETFGPKLEALCNDAGVILAFVPSIPRAHVAGVTRWFGPRRPMIQMSLYGGTNDHFWFTFFHEAAHVLLHKKQGLILDDFSNKTEVFEKQANEFARKTLIPDEFCGKLNQLHDQDTIKAFATKVGIHPGIVLGRLQHDDILPYQSNLNGLKARYRFVEANRN